MKELLSKINLVRDYRAFKKFNLGTDKSFLKFLKNRWRPHFKKNRYYPVDPNSTVSGRNIILGKGSVIGQRGGCYIQGIGRLFIGDYVRITQNCIITSANHSALDHSIEIKKETIIGDYCWIASNACVMAGVVLGPRTIVGAGSVVTKSFPEGYCVIAGNPAKLIKQLDPKDFVKPAKDKIEYYGYIRADKFPAYFKKNLSKISFEYDLSKVTSNPIFHNKSRENG